MKPIADKLIYIYDPQLIQQCDRIPVIKTRASRVHELIRSYGLLERLKVVPSKLATKDHLRLCHSAAYLEVLEGLNTSGTINSDDDDYDDDRDYGEEFGLGYDCPRIPKLLEFCQRIAGATLSAADALIDGAQVAVNWCGGWHHGQRDAAAGFCYVNDIVIGIQRLLQVKYQRILYIDLDIHHGDGVENAFSTTKRVFTLSFHQCEAGFFPGTGKELAAGFGAAAHGYAVNYPFKQHISGENYKKQFKLISSAVFGKFKPQVIVLQCGADILAGDPLGGANLTTQDMGECVRHVKDFGVPMMVLGGGGYHLSNAARYWTYLTAILCDAEIDEDLPDNEHFLDYGPTYELHVERRWLKDENSATVLDDNSRKILQNLEQLI